MKIANATSRSVRYSSNKEVYVNEILVGWLVVHKNGWRQQELKRGSPSQSWEFISNPKSEIKISYSYSWAYLADIKRALEKIILDD